MEVIMRKKMMFSKFKLLMLLLAMPCFTLELIADEGFKGKDTLVYKAWKDTVRLTKAQAFNLNSSESMIIYKPRPFEFISHIPSDMIKLGKVTVAKRNLSKIGLIVGSSALLVAFDQQILDGCQQFGRFLNINPERKFTRAIAFNIGNMEVPVLDLPQNLNSVFYFLGEGWPSILVAGSFWGYGIAKDDYRARQTASQLGEMFFSLAITTQLLKRLSGRQSPFQSTKPGGEWRPFVNWGTYQEDVSNYDAFPSGHLATIMATVTILAGNYPNNKYIKPVGYSLMGLVGYAMVNNGVHWMGDYPLAIAVGYACGTIALGRGQKIVSKKSNVSGYKSSIMPLFLGHNGYGLSYRLTF
jgi:hypothetical protein